MCERTYACTHAHMHARTHTCTRTRAHTGSKEELDRAPGELRYHQVHEMHHRFYRDLLRAKGYYDIFLFDTTGELIYSVYKELDYATNFIDGPYAQSGLGKAFRGAMENPSRVHHCKTSVKLCPRAPSTPPQSLPVCAWSCALHNLYRLHCLTAYP